VTFTPKLRTSCLSLVRIVALAIDPVAAIAHGDDKIPQQAKPTTRSSTIACSHSVAEW